MPYAEMPARDGYVFGGYYDQTDGQGNKYYDAAGNSARRWDKNFSDSTGLNDGLSDQAVLYAHWAASVQKPMTFLASIPAQESYSPVTLILEDVSLPAGSYKMTMSGLQVCYDKGEMKSKSMVLYLYYAQDQSSSTYRNVAYSCSLPALYFLSKYDGNIQVIGIDKNDGWVGSFSVTCTFTLSQAVEKFALQLYAPDPSDDNGVWMLYAPVGATITVEPA